jgi:two-component system cell cycle response regulator
LLHADERGLEALANSLREAISEATFSSGLEVTASFGFGMLNPVVSIDRNITKIDDALYQAKKSGRNCAVAADIN